jgi:hypothetical protein
MFSYDEMAGTDLSSYKRRFPPPRPPSFTHTILEKRKRREESTF